VVHRRTSILVVGLSLVLACGGERPRDDAAPGAGAEPPPGDASGWEQDVFHWRMLREERLRAEYGWLSVVGLDWLEPGANRIGAASDSRVRLPPAVAPPHVATLHLDGDAVRLEPVAGSPLLVDGEPARPRPVSADTDPEPTEFRVGDLRFHVIRRGERIGVRSRWPRAATRERFSGLSWYAPDRSYRVVGRLDRDAEPIEIAVPNVLGQTETSLSLGPVRFELRGAEHTLHPVVDSSDDRSLFFVFRDATAGKTTYPAGRFLYADLEDDGTVVLDFNRAYSPPCAFTPFATCPLPPGTNVLEVAIEAGERHDGHPARPEDQAVPDDDDRATGLRRASESSTS
jgi:uncharacterized protein (DUF1684 family)